MQPDPRLIRQNYVISFTTRGGSAATKTKQLGFYDKRPARSGVRRRNGRTGGGFGGGGGGGASAATKAEQLGYYDKEPTSALEAARREAMLEFRSRWDLNSA